MQHQGHPPHHAPNRPRIVPQYQPRPPPPPQPVVQQQQPQNEIMLNVEHHFTDNGKIVRKMPIKMGDQIIWVDCADEAEVRKFIKFL